MLQRATQDSGRDFSLQGPLTYTVNQEAWQTLARDGIKSPCPGGSQSLSGGLEDYRGHHQTTLHGDSTAQELSDPVLRATQCIRQTRNQTGVAARTQRDTQHQREPRRE